MREACRVLYAVLAGIGVLNGLLAASLPRMTGSPVRADGGVVMAIA